MHSVARTLLLFASVFVVAESSACGDGSSCPDGSTCCKLSDKEWGCCPFLDAVCCDDHVHCCPEDTTCDVSMGRCISAAGEVFLAEKKTRAQKNNEENDIICPDQRSKCPSGSTCCLLVSGKYGCCPVEGANCCADHLHCCPSGFECDTSGQRCIKEKTRQVIGSYRKFPGTPIRHKPAVNLHHSNKAIDESDEEITPISCGYGRSCPARSTCCTTSTLGRIRHMCCPLQNAVCCEDTCCPAGYHCRSNGRCEKRAVRDFLSDIEF
ncbi:hypothetical protein Q1695_008604 [Nippostrongylus brasiliensis]|nr:hypothetical protein Q1695_008604 [Nippostrongylus brasiliensis]